MISKKKLVTFISCIAIIIAIYTQFPNVNKNVLSIFNYLIWGINILVIVITDRKVYCSQYFKLMILFGTFIFVFQLILSATTIVDSVSSLSTLLIVPSIVYYVSFRLGKYENETKSIRLLLIIGLGMVSVLAFQIASNMLLNFSSWLNTRVYLYEGNTHKNSIGQILASAIIIDLFYFKAKSKIQYVIKGLLAGMCAISLLYVQSRSSMIGLAVVGISIVLMQKDRKKKYIYILEIIVISIILMNIKSVVEIVDQALLLNKYSSAGSLDLDSFSSGRLGYWYEAWKVFADSPIWGGGHRYVDNFYLNCLENGGIIGSTLFFILLIKRFVMNFKLASYSGEYLLREREVLRLLTIFYMCISFFEAYPPFGPGVATIFLWIFIGYIDGANSR